MFFDLLLYCSAHSSNMSLEHSIAVLSDLYGITISKQSLDERFSERTVEFVKEVFVQALEIELGYCYNGTLFPQFNYIRIKDSTKFNIDDRLEKQFKGSGGRECKKACVCIQYEYDIKSGKILDLSIMPGASSDATNARDTQCNINSRDLVIRDLGYYNLEILSSFQESGAYFISRLNTSTSVYYADSGTQISFKELYNEMVHKNISLMEINALVSKGQKKMLRLLVTIIPETEYEKRIRKINKYNKEKGYSTSDDYKSRARFNIFISNITKDMMSVEDILLIYRLRWQIELTFKTWKSVCAIDKLQPMKYERFICVLISKLILIALKMKLFWNISNYFYEGKKKLLSLYKCFKTFQDTYQLFRVILKTKKKKSEESVSGYVKIFSKNHWKEKRKKRKNCEEILCLFVCDSIEYTYLQEEKKRQHNAA